MLKRGCFRTSCAGLFLTSSLLVSPGAAHRTRCFSHGRQLGKARHAAVIEVLAGHCALAQEASKVLGLRRPVGPLPGFALPLLFTELAAHPGILDAFPHLVPTPLHRVLRLGLQEATIGALSAVQHFDGELGSILHGPRTGGHRSHGNAAGLRALARVVLVDHRLEVLHAGVGMKVGIPLGVLEDALRHGPVHLIPACLSLFGGVAVGVNRHCLGSFDRGEFLSSTWPRPHVDHR
mmetsp:Transcript_32684/g.45629  ORF Transcript_32684/g.45629 Transcript_32684/m.45629 type:complete len:235 (+) Transcript_32684:95-799(+)